MASFKLDSDLMMVVLASPCAYRHDDNRRPHPDTVLRLFLLLEQSSASPLLPELMKISPF